jgi:serine/threonine protein phosphatase PrpC
VLWNGGRREKAKKVYNNLKKTLERLTTNGYKKIKSSILQKKEEKLLKISELRRDFAKMKCCTKKLYIHAEKRW